MPLVAPVTMKTSCFLKDAIQRAKITHFTRFVFISVRVAAEEKVNAHFDDSTK